MDPLALARGRRAACEALIPVANAHVSHPVGSVGASQAEDSASSLDQPLVVDGWTRSVGQG